MNTPNRSLRVPDYQWRPAVAKAEREGTTLSHVIRGWIATYLAEDREAPTVSDAREPRPIPVPPASSEVLDDWLGAVDRAAMEVS